MSPRKLRRIEAVKARKLARKAGFPQLTNTAATAPVLPLTDAAPSQPTSSESSTPAPLNPVPVRRRGTTQNTPAPVAPLTTQGETDHSPLTPDHSVTPDASAECAEPGFPMPPFSSLSSRRLEANARNAKLAKGALTPETQAICAQNHTIHGLARHQNGAFKLLSSEDPKVFDALKQSLLDEHQPTTQTEGILVHRMVESEWLSQRAQHLQDSCLHPGTGEVTDEKKFSLYMRYQTTHTRAFHKCLLDLTRLRKDKTQAEHGFEAQRLRQEAQRVESEKHELKKDLQYWENLKKDAAACRELSALATQNCAARRQDPAFDTEYNAELNKRGLKLNFWEAASRTA